MVSQDTGPHSHPCHHLVREKLTAPAPPAGLVARAAVVVTELSCPLPQPVDVQVAMSLQYEDPLPQYPHCERQLVASAHGTPLHPITGGCCVACSVGASVGGAIVDSVGAAVGGIVVLGAGRDVAVVGDDVGCTVGCGVVDGTSVATDPPHALCPEKHASPVGHSEFSPPAHSRPR